MRKFYRYKRNHVEVISFQTSKENEMDKKWTGTVNRKLREANSGRPELTYTPFYENDDLEPGKIKNKILSDPERCIRCQNGVIGSNIIEFCDMDIYQFVNDNELRDTPDQGCVTQTIRGCDGKNFFVNFLPSIYNLETYLFEKDKIDEMVALQKKYRELMEHYSRCDKKPKEVGEYPKSGKLSEQLSYDYDIYTGTDWIEFSSIEQALDFEFNLLFKASINVFECENCKKLSVGRENAKYCSRMNKFNWDNVGENLPPIVYSCQNSTKDKRVKDRLGQEAEAIEKISYKQRNAFQNYKKNHEPSDYREDNAEIRKLLNGAFKRAVKNVYAQLDEDDVKTKKKVCEIYEESFQELRCSVENSIFKTFADIQDNYWKQIESLTGISFEEAMQMTME